MKSNSVSSLLVCHSENVWLISGASQHAALIRLANGELLLWGAPTFDRALATEIAMLGVLKHLLICSANSLDDLQNWRNALPNCQLWACPGARRAASKQGLQVNFTNDLGASPDPNWSAVMDQLLFTTSNDGEVILYHYESKTLIIEHLLSATSSNLLKRLVNRDQSQPVRVAKSLLRSESDKTKTVELLNYMSVLKADYIYGRDIGLLENAQDIVDSLLADLS